MLAINKYHEWLAHRLNSLFIVVARVIVLDNTLATLNMLVYIEIDTCSFLILATPNA